jgi:hypothetical protein
MLKCLSEFANNIPSEILNTLQLIFGMDCCEFNIEGKLIVLFRVYIQDNIDEEWINILSSMLNNLIKYKRDAV